MDNLGMQGREISFTPDRLIAEPVVFRGMTDTEIVYLTLGGTVFWIPVCCLILAPIGFAMFGVAVGFGLALLTLMILGKKLTTLKRRMPDGLHVVYLKKTLQRKLSFVSRYYIDTTQAWDVRRTVIVTKPERVEIEE
jgi:conjugative transfer region protein (TIGR03750 family)